MIGDLIEMMFAAKRQLAAPGQVLIEPTDASATQYWVVPANVYEICLVMVSRSGYDTPVSLYRGGTLLFSTNSAVNGASSGGGNGGEPGNPGGNRVTYYGGWGGAGGYTGNGGRGGDGVSNPTPPQPGSGGGGGGGSGGNGTIGQNGDSGGSVGLYGQGANGAGADGTNPDPGMRSHGYPGSPAANGRRYGAGPGLYDYTTSVVNGRGGNLRWINNLPVNPGETLTLAFALARRYKDWVDENNMQLRQAFNEGCRILWYGGRSFPYNAGDR